MNLSKQKFLDYISAQKAISAIIFQIVLVILGFFSGRVTVAGGISPFGIGLTGGIPSEFLMSSALGAFAGYILKPGFADFSYIAALFAITCTRLILGAKSKLSNNPRLVFFITLFFSALCRGVTIGGGGSGILMGVAEGAVAAAGSYMISRAGKVEFLGGTGNSPEDTASLIIAAHFLLMGLYPIAVQGISLGRIISIVLILIVSRVWRAGIGTVCGVACAFCSYLAGGSLKLSAVIIIAACLCGVFSSFSKYLQAAVMAAVCAVSVIFEQGDSYAVSLMLESLLGGVIFVILPSKLTAKINAAISSATNIEDFDGLRQAIVRRLGFASDAMRDVCETVEKVSQRLSEYNSPDFEEVIQRVENEACKGCTFRLNCWEASRQETVAAMLALSYSVKRGVPLSVAELPVNFAEKCLRLEWVENSFEKHYSDFSRKVAAEQRISEMREVLTDQFGGISNMLMGLAEEFETAEKYDREMASQVVSGLKTLDIQAVDCGCSIDSFGRISLEIRLKKEPELPFNRLRVLKLLEDICGREFEPPAILKIGGEMYITVTEKANFMVEYACSSCTPQGNVVCGDAYECFFDGRGRFYMLLCDGMGNGGRAAVDGAMAAGLMARLLKAGFGYECSLKIMNSAMVFKSTDESLSTVDIACIDLFTGQTELLKAGAAPTIVRRSGKTGRAECHSLPVGILSEVGFDKATITLKDDDIVLIMSDGATADGTDWICAEVESWGDGSAKQLSDHILQCARRRRTDGHEDDVTVISAILQRAV